MKSRDEIKWEFRRREKEALQRRWMEEDIQEARMRAQINQTNPELPQMGLNNLNSLDEIRSRQQAIEIKTEVRRQALQDLENRWFEADIREAEREAKIQALKNDLDLFR